MPVAEVMTRNVICVFEDFSVDTLEELLLERGLSGAPVVNDDGKLVGFVSMTDIVQAMHDRGDSAGDDLGWGYHAEQPRLVRELMTPVAFELQESCPVAKAIELMATQHVHRVLVVSEQGELAGIVTAGDLVQHVARAGRVAPEPADAGERDRVAETDRLMALGFVAGGVAHQINNALTPMRLSLGRLTSFELSRRPISAARLHRIELLQDVREGVARIEQVIRELKEFSHTDEGPMRAVDVASQLELAIGLANHLIRHRARLVCDYARVPQVRASPAKLRQVLLNLLVNAAQAIPDGEAHLNEIRLLTRTDERGRAVIEIADTGSGIPSDVVGRIFEPFFTTRRDRLGLGLGLTVSRDLVAAMGGDITVDSVAGKGTTVRVVLPPCDDAAVAVVAAVAPLADPADQPVRRRILIIDDDRPVAAAIALELSAHDVVVAESGREALEILRRDRGFDVILCDLMMPEISGMDVYESLRLVDPALLERVVLMTGGAFTARAGEFLADNEALLIEKPFHPGQLQAMVDALDHRREAVDETSATTPWRPYEPSREKGAQE